MLRWVPAATLVVGLVLITLYALRPIADPDIWWHLKTGEIIVETGAIPRVDAYSHTAAGKPWVAHEWLSEVIFHLATVPFGLNGLRVLNALAAVVLLGLLWRRCRQASAHPLVAAAVWAACVTLCMPFMTWRPHIFSIPIVILLLPRVLFPAQAVYTNRRLALLAAGFWLWANLHSMVCLGIILLGVSWAAVCVTHWLRCRSGNPPTDDNERRLPVRMGIQLAVVSIAVLLTPNGLGVYWYATVGAWLITHSPLPIAEWLPGANDWASWLKARLFDGNFEAFGSLDWRNVLAIAVIAAVIRCGWRATRDHRSVSLPGLAIAGLFAVAAVEHRRGLWLLVPALLFVLAPGGLGWRMIAALPTPAPLGRRAVVGVLAVLAVSVGTWANEVRQKPLSFTDTVDASRYPVGLTAFLRDAGLEGKLCNELGWGGYLIRELHPRCRVFIHGEIPFYTGQVPEVVATYGRLVHDPGSIRETLDDLGIDLLVTSSARISDGPSWIRTETARASLGVAASPAVGPDGKPASPWRKVFANREGAVFLNTVTPLGKANLERCRTLYAHCGIPLLKDSAPDLSDIVASAPYFARTYRLVPQTYWAHRAAAADGAANRAILLDIAEALLRSGWPQEAGRHFQRVLDANLGDADAALGLAEVAHDVGNWSECRRLLVRAEFWSPGHAGLRRFVAHMRDNHLTPATPGADFLHDQPTAAALGPRSEPSWGPVTPMPRGIRQPSRSPAAQ